MSSLSTYTWWYYIDGALYIALLFGALYRLGRKVMIEGCRAPLNKTQIPVYLVFAALACYGLVRAVVMILTGMRKVPDDEGLSECMFDMIPAFFFCLLQTFLIAKWAGHVSDISMVLHHRPFRWHRPIIILSGVLSSSVAVETFTVLADQSRSSPLVAADTWVEAVNVSCGMIYIINGAMFAALGVTLRTKWQPSSTADVGACRRILAIAVVFGGVCIARGVALLLFADRSRTSIVYSGWGTPLIIMVEWFALVTSLFALTNVSGSSSQSTTSMDAYATEPMIGSSRNAIGTTRRGMGSWRVNSQQTPNATPLRSISPADSRGLGCEDDDDPALRRQVRAAQQIGDEDALPPSTASLAINDACE